MDDALADHGGRCAGLGFKTREGSRAQFGRRCKRGTPQSLPRAKENYPKCNRLPARDPASGVVCLTDTDDEAQRDANQTADGPARLSWLVVQQHSALLPDRPRQQNAESARRQRKDARTITTDRKFYGKWIAANGVAEAAGLGATFLLGGAAGPLLARTDTLAEVLLAGLIAVLLGTVLEGVVVGVAQGSVLRVRAPEVTLRSWIAATAVGAGLAWMVGSIPSSVMALTDAASSGGPVEEPALLTRLLLAAGLGLVTGPILGIAQWVVLRRHFGRAGSWLWANAFAWALGMSVIFAGMDLVPWEGSVAARTTAIVSVCLAAGLVVGAVHGSVLLGMTRPASSSAPA